MVRFFRWYCNDHLAEAVLGDLLELYERRRKTIGRTKANWLFFWNALTFLQPFAIKKRKPSPQNNIAMFENYLKISWRTMSRQKMYSAIKVGGFALGLASCMLIFLFIQSELSYDRAFVGEPVYKLYNDWRGPGGGRWPAMPANTATILNTEYPEVELAGRLIQFKWFNAGSNLIRRDDGLDNTYEEGFVYADNETLKILNIEMVRGNQSDALSKPGSIVISKKMADKYFPNEDPLGKILILNDEKSKPFVIGGVMKDLPPNTHMQFEFLITLANVEFWPGEQTSWCCWNYEVYFRLRPDADLKAFEAKLYHMRDKYLVPHLEEIGDQSLADEKKYHFFGSQPVSDIYLNEQSVGDEGKHGDIRYIWMFGGVAMFVLLLACINFINLSTAKSANRAKEVGLRKVVGSLRSYLVRQFLIESLVYSFISFALAIVIVVLALPFFNSLSGKQLAMPWTDWRLIPALIIGAIMVGVVAGIYPAFYLSGFKPAEVLKGGVSRGSKSSGLRSAMVVFQFTTSIVLIVGTFVIYKQMNFILNTKIGFDKDQVLMIHGANTLGKQYESFKNELKQLAEVEDATINNYLPVEGTNRDNNGFWKEGRNKIDKAVYGQIWGVDDDYIPTLGMKLIEGRNFDRKIKSDTAAIIINQEMAKQLGLTVGQRMQNYRVYQVIGIVEDFHFETMKGQIRPLCMVYREGGDIASVRVKSKNMSGAVESINRLWIKFMPHQPFRYTFMDENYARMYEDVERMGNIFAAFATLAIIVACLGLFALSSFMVEQRRKEIGIRLVMGATVNNIFHLLTGNFLKLVLISFAIATPIAWYMMRTWLEDYKYKIPLSWDLFVVAGMLSLIIAMATISYQTLAAAFVSPAKSLRSE
jgi:putative ABC transport system permease protein